MKNFMSLRRECPGKQIQCMQETIEVGNPKFTIVRVLQNET